ncbi:hypothetical protein Tco_0775292 [Tanacetum coccineum]
MKGNKISMEQQRSDLVVERKFNPEEEVTDQIAEGNDVLVEGVTLECGGDERVVGGGGDGNGVVELLQIGLHGTQSTVQTSGHELGQI